MNTARTKCLLLLGVSITACGQTKHAESGPATPAAILAAVGDGPYSFSFEYTAAPPAGRRLHAAALTGVGDPCSVFSGAAPPANFSAVNVVISGTELATYAVAPVTAVGEASGSYVEWVTVENGVVVATIRAAGGSIRYASGPTDEATWIDHRVAELVVEADVETDPVITSVCNGSQDMDSGPMTSSCTCDRLGGSSFECVSSGNDCCHDDPGEVEHVQFTIQAQACPQQCRFTQPELAVWCRDLG
jgi:hypothetical protein